VIGVNREKAQLPANGTCSTEAFPRKVVVKKVSCHPTLEPLVSIFKKRKEIKVPVYSSCS
jgi:hypothetical protein